MAQQEENPWTILSKETKHESPFIRVDYHDVLTPAKTQGQYSTVHFKNLALGIVPLDEEYNTWIVGQYRFPIETYSWEIPEGGGAHDVPPLESAKRELSEEVGLAAKDWQLIQTFNTSNSCTDEKAFIYVARDLEQHDSHPDEEEELVIRKLPFSELYQMALDGVITDSLTLIAVFKVQHLIQNNLI